MKILKKVIFLAFCGIGCSAIAQEIPNPMETLKPWINDSVSGLTNIRYVGEWGGELGEGPEIIRDAENNKVSVREKISEFDFDFIQTWFYSENRNLGWVSYQLERIDTLGNSEIPYKISRNYDEAGVLLSEIIEDNGVKDTLYYKDGKQIPSKDWIREEVNDTVVYSKEIDGFKYVKKFNDKGDLVYVSDSTQTITYELTYDTTIMKIVKRKEVLTDIESGKTTTNQETFEYDSKGQLIKRKGRNVFTDYVYDHNGNLTLEFSATGDYYSGSYIIYEYEGGKKKEYPAFDPKNYPTDNYPANSPVAIHGKLQVSGRDMVDVNGEPVVLKGISTHDIMWFERCYNESSLNAMVDEWGINVFRLASYTEEYIKSSSNAEKRREFIDNMVDLCEQKGIYCIIDWHILNSGTNDPWYKVDSAKVFFDYMSKKHAGKAHVIYELCNEPNGSISWARIKSYAQEIIDIIVKNDPSSIIIAGTPVWSQRVIAAADSPLDYPNAMYTLHFYADTHKQDLRNAADVALSKNCPLFVTEFGTCNSSGNSGFNVKESIEWFKWMKENNISWANWSFADKDETASLLFPNSCKKGKWTNYSESGRLIKWALSDEDLSGADSVIVVEDILRGWVGWEGFLNSGNRLNYVGNTILTYADQLEGMKRADLIHFLVDSVYAQECIEENPSLSGDSTAISNCILEKRTGLNDVISPLEGVEIYPTIVDETLTIDYTGGDFRVEVFNLLGTKVVEDRCEQGRNLINVSYLTPGTYLILVESDGKIHLEKMQKK
ncbi:MAG: hypothetical protein E7072_04055 [Bacteroidales bacterium]|nr:hypothetical protein [Bacteroidales bacterium]